MPQQYSITSSPRVTSPIASESTLPCSATSSRATSSRRSCTSSRIRKNSSARFASEVARHAGNAALRRLDGRVDLLDGGEVDGAGLRAGRRVVHGAAAAGRPGDAAPVDPVADPLDARLLGRGRGCQLGHLERLLVCLLERSEDAASV